MTGDNGDPIQELEKRQKFIEMFQQFVRDSIDLSAKIKNCAGNLLEICEAILGDSSLKGIKYANDKWLDVYLKCRAIKTLFDEINQAKTSIFKPSLGDELSLESNENSSQEWSLDDLTDAVLGKKTIAKTKEPSVIKTKNVLQNESIMKNQQSKPHLERSAKEINLIELLSFLGLVGKIQHENESEPEMDFNTLIENEFDQSSFESLLNSSQNKGTFISEIKPFMLDALKLNSRLTSIMDKFAQLDLGKEKMKSIKQLTERNLICSLVESMPSRFHGRLGELLIKNNYPLPMVYQLYNQREDEVITHVNFDLLRNVLCLTNKKLALFTWTRGFSLDQKSITVQSLFPSVDITSWLRQRKCGKQEYSLDQSCPSWPSVDVQLNEENMDDKEWIIANINGLKSNSHESTQFACLVDSLCAYSSLHIINAFYSDFEDSEPNEEISTHLEWYKRMYGSSLKVANLLVLVHRDANSNNEEDEDEDDEEGLTNDESKKLTQITQSLNDIFKVHPSQLQVRSDLELDRMRSSLLTTDNMKTFRSILNMENFFFNLLKSGKIVENKKLTVEREFENLFNFDLTINDHSTRLSKIFPLSALNRSINYLKCELQQLIAKPVSLMDSNLIKRRNFLEIEILSLTEQLKAVNYLNPYMTFFIEIVLQSQPDYTNLLIFEKLLLNFKRERIHKLRTARQQLKADDQLRQASDEDKRLDLEKRRRALDDQIEDVDLSIDKFWDELFLLFDSLTITQTDERSNLRDALVDKYIYLVLDAGYPIHILRGQPLAIQSDFLKRVFGKLSTQGPIYVFSVIGLQSSAKSALLNALFGLNFKESAGRCTIGIYMHFLRTANKTIAVLDTEGLGSVDSNSIVFDNQMATMSILSSNVVILNHKGEISTNLQRILGITFYAKMRLSPASFQPSVVFVLRDQNNRDDESQFQSQALKLNEGLQKSSEFSGRDLESVLQIDTNTVWLLPNAISEEKDKKTKIVKRWRNQIFPEEVLKLRRFLLELLEKPRQTGFKKSLSQSFSSFEHLYTKLTSNWDVLLKIGDGILSCEDLDGLRIRNELSNIAETLLEKHISKFDNQAEHFHSILNSKLNQIIEIEYLENEFEQLYEAAVVGMKEDFEKHTGAESFYPAAIKNTCQTRMLTAMESRKASKINQLKEAAFGYNQKKNIQYFRQQMNIFFSEIVNSEFDSKKIQNMVDLQFEKLDKEFLEIQKNKTLDSETLVNRIREFYFSSVKMLGDRHREYSDLAAIYDPIYFKSFIKNPSDQIESKKWILDEFEQTIDAKQQVFEIQDTLYQDIIPELEALLKNLSFDSSLVRRALMILSEKLLRNSTSNNSETDSLPLLNRLLVVHDVTLLALRHLYTTVMKLNVDKLARDSIEYASLKSEWRREIEECIQAKNNSRSAGIIIGQKFKTDFFEFILEKEKPIVERLIKKNIEMQFPKQESLLELAFKKSFAKLNYVNVLKYILDLNKFCAEIFADQCQDDFDGLISKRLSTVKENVRTMIEFIAYYDRASSLDNSSAHVILQGIQDLASKNTQLKDLSHYIKIITQTTVDMNVGDPDVFLSEFKNTVSTADFTRSEVSMKNLENELNELVRSEKKKFIQYFYGCSIRCPGCGAKCQFAADHTGGHKAHKHLISGFFAKKSADKNDVVSTDFCWSKKIYLDTKIGILSKRQGECKPAYSNLKALLAERFPDWSEDIESNYQFYGNPVNQKNSVVLEYTYNVTKSWMNTRKALIKNFNVSLSVDDLKCIKEKMESEPDLNRHQTQKIRYFSTMVKAGRSLTFNISDKSTYSDFWLSLEDQAKILNDNFKIDGYEWTPFI